METEKKDLSELVERTTVYPLTEDGERFLEFNLPASVKRALTLLENAGIIQDYYFSKCKLAIALLLEKTEPDEPAPALQDGKPVGGKTYRKILAKLEEEAESSEELGDHCAYPGHATRKACPTKRYTVIAPKDKLGRARTFEVCVDAVEFARNRGYEVPGRFIRSESPESPLWAKPRDNDVVVKAFVEDREETVRLRIPFESLDVGQYAPDVVELRPLPGPFKRAKSERVLNTRVYGETPDGDVYRVDLKCYQASGDIRAVSPATPVSTADYEKAVPKAERVR